MAVVILNSNKHSRDHLSFFMGYGFIYLLCRNFLELDKTCAPYYGNRSAAYLMTKDYNHALDDAKIAIQLDENYIKV
jgi:hypothetical protein